MRPSASYDARGTGESRDTASFGSPAAQATARLGEEDRTAGGRNNEVNEKSYCIEFGICAADGRGVDSILGELLSAASTNVDEPSLITRARHRQALIDARDCLHRALLAEDDDLIAEELRLAGRAFGRLTGRIDVEDVLDVIFRDFCIGK
jgi:tRNA modification GTPase